MGKDVQKINNFLQKKEKVYLFGAHIFSINNLFKFK